MARSGAPGRGFRFTRGAVRALLAAFFRDVESTGTEHVPDDRGAVIVSWHPNALVDPALILVTCPRPVFFGARHGLFRVPLLGALMRVMGTVPVYRAQDPTGMDTNTRRTANRSSLAGLAERVAAGDCATLFPEGESHDRPHPTELKSGAARLYYAARDSAGPRPVILPVGLHYERKRMFRSRALVWYHRPIEIPVELDRDLRPDASSSERERLARELTEVVDSVLQDVVHATEDWETHRILHRGRKILHFERAHREGKDPGEPRVAEQAVGFRRIRAAYYRRREENPAGVATLRRSVEAYDEDLRALGLEDQHLDRAPQGRTWGLVFWLLAQVVLVFLLFPPLLVVGYLVNGPPAVLVALLSRLGKRPKDVASLKILLGAVLFPAAWVVAAFLAARAHLSLHARYPALPDTPILAGLVLGLSAFLGGLVALRYARLARETWRALRVRLTRARRADTVRRLRRERARLYDAMLALARGAGSS
ncbi:MAG: hypothetical protein GY716_23595 [bacterium]|nr:hypothetical protein [bacterium]